MLSHDQIQRAVQTALDEDIGPGDVTTLATVAPEISISAQMVAREALTLAGIDLAEAAFRQLCPDLPLQRLAVDGQSLAKGDAILKIQRAPARSVLTAERVALNFLQRLSGIATLTAQYVQAIAGTRAVILDTRKTTPGLRALEKYAVTCGGGQNYRLGLHDRILIKDNHLAALADAQPSPIVAAITRARAAYPQLTLEIEADTPAQAEEAARAGADIILLDNMSLDQLRHCVQLIARRAQTEASGGVNLNNVRAIAETGVDFISVGALTHSARAVDIALDFIIDTNVPRP